MLKYYMLMCQAPIGQQPALLTYHPDEVDRGVVRTWKSCKRFLSPPPNPIPVFIDVGESGLLLELYDATVAIMSRRLATVLTGAGVSNIDFYDVLVDDLETGQEYDTHVAFNIVGSIAVADLSRSDFSAPDGPMVSMDFESLTIDTAKAHDALLFRLAESVNGIVVHERIKHAIADAGIDTVECLPPHLWVG